MSLNAFTSSIPGFTSVMKNIAGIKCTYYQAYGEEEGDSANGFAVTMWRGGKVMTEPTPYGPQEWEIVDFCCIASELTDDRGVSQVTPERGHVITFEDENGDTQVFTVAMSGEGNPYRYMDRAKQILRIHCREGI